MKNNTDIHREISLPALTLDKLQQLNLPLCSSILKQGNNTDFFLITLSEMHKKKHCKSNVSSWFIILSITKMIKENQNT